MTSVYRQPLRSLQPGAQNALVIGVIINSLNTKTFDSSRTRFNNGERGVWTFTLRDTEEDYINVTVWGSAEFIKKLYSSLRIGTVVEVINPKVVKRDPNDRNEIFVPSTPSSCALVVNEGKSLLQIHDAPTLEEYEHLLMLPVKSPEGIRSLKDIYENLETLRDHYVDVLIVVTFVSDNRNIFTRDGRNIKCRSFEGADGSADKGVSLILWENEWVERAAFWQPKQTVLFLANARVAYDNYKKETLLSIVRKTLITENPEIPQAQDIKNIVRCCNSDTMTQNPFAVPNPDTITTVMTVQEISSKINQKTREGERIQFGTILKASVMDLNVDSSSSEIVSLRCALCKRFIQDAHDSCMNLECPCGNGTRVPINLISLNLKMNLKDDTGYLIGCKLNGEVAERALGCTATEFQAMTKMERTELKWKYLLEKCDVRLHVLGPTPSFPNTIYNILSICRTEENCEEGDGKVGNEEFAMDDY